MKKLLMGNEAIALGAVRAGVNIVTGYPGTPSSEILETVAKNNDGSIYVEWSVNEKTALEVAAGGAYAGARVMVTMKQVGLNVASDPLMSLNYVGVKGGMVVIAADDPGPISSQTEQDTRHFGLYAKLAVFDPSTPEEAYQMIGDAFDFSEKYGVPVLFRPTTRVCHSCAGVELLPDMPRKAPEGFKKDSRWVIFPRLTYTNHIKIENALKEMSAELSAYPPNKLDGTGKRGITAGGVSWQYVLEALSALGNPPVKLLKVSAYPFPKKLGQDFLDGLDEALVVEELDPVIEKELHALGSKVVIHGKLDGTMPVAGENSADGVKKAIAGFLGMTLPDTHTPEPPPLPARPPVLCAGCPHRESFLAVKEASSGRSSVYSGDIGCYTLGNTLDMVDTCLCMGAGITVAQGLQRVEPGVLHFAFIGDSTFFHTGIPGVINAVANQTDIIIVVLDNSTTAMTGNQPHPGLGRTMMGGSSKKVDIYKLMEAIGVDFITRVNPFETARAKDAVREAMEHKGVRVVLFEAPCIKIRGGASC